VRAQPGEKADAAALAMRTGVPLEWIETGEISTGSGPTPGNDSGKLQIHNLRRLDFSRRVPNAVLDDVQAA